MLEQINLKRKLPKKDYKASLPNLQRRLYDLEKTCWDQKIPSIVIFSGWDAAGKGSAISSITERLDPRGFKQYNTQAPRTNEKQYPWLWRYWLQLPSYGEMGIFDLSWYQRVLTERVEKLTPKKAWQRAYRDIVEFERMVSDDGTVIVKLWLHINKKEQKKRFKALEQDPLESWRVTKTDWKRHKKYDDYLLAAEEMFEQTDTEWGPWSIIEAHDRCYARRKIFTTLIAALEQRLGDLAPPVRTSGKEGA